jgi:RHS repeat-associated protein
MPSVDQAGQHVVTLIATDADGGSAIESFQLDVLSQNTAPVINSPAPIDVAAGALFTYDVLASDLDSDPLRFELTDAPAGATIDRFGQIRWETEELSIGSHPFSVRVSDPRGGQVEQNFTLNVIEDVIAPRLSAILSPGESPVGNIPWGDQFRIFVRAIDNVEIASLTLQANGQDIPLDAAGTAEFTFAQWGFTGITATATAIDTNGNRTTKTNTFAYDFPQGWNGQGGEEVPTAIITSPADTASVTGMVSIVGTASHENFAAYKLSYRRVDDSVFTEFYESTIPVTNGELGVWDTSLLLNDEYVIRLQVATTDAVVNVVDVHIGLAGELKLGNFRLSFTDMVIPVAGIPIEITRIYDTLQADREGDFGYGWRLEYRNTDLRVGLPKSGLEDIGIYTALRPGVKVYLNVPGEGRQGFTFNPDIRVLPGFGGNNLVLARPRFTPDPGVTSSLSTGVSQYLQVNEQGELYAPGGIPYNPASPDFGGAYVLSTRDGVTYRIDGANGKMISATDRNGNLLEFDEAGITSRDQFQILFRRNANGQIIEITDLEGNSIHYRYGAVGDLVSVVDREGNETSLTYHDERPHYLDGIVDPLGRVGDRLEYDDHGRLISTVNVRGGSTSYSFDPDNFVGEVVGPLGERLSFEYDNYGNVVATTDVLGHQYRHTFDSNGAVLTTTDPLGNTTSYTRNRLGDPTRVVDAVGVVVYYTYNSNGDLVAMTNSLGDVEQREYDPAGNLVARVDADGAVTRYEYDDQGNRTRMIDPLGNSREYQFDEFGNEITQLDRNGYALDFTFNANGVNTGSSTTRTDPNGGQVPLSTVIDVNGNGSWTSVTDPLGHVTSQELDTLGRLQATIDPMGRRVEMRGNDTPIAESVIFPGDQSLAYEFDLNNQVTSITNKGGFKEKYAYDEVGNLVQRILPDGTPNDDSDNPTYLYEYDALRRMIAATDPNGSRQQYRYDAVGNQLSAIDPMGNESSWQYDSEGRLTVTTDRLQRSTRYAYNPAGLLVQTVYPDSATIAFEYDKNGNRIRSIDVDGNATQFGYDNEGQLMTVTDVSGHVTSYQRDSLGNVTTQVDALGRETRYEYDLLSNQTQITRPLNQSSSRTYLADGQLETETDFAGNTTSYTYGLRGELRRIEFSDGNSIAYEYDDFGNPIRTIDSVDGTSTASYDERNQLLEMTRPDDSFLRYRYDQAGNLISLTSPGGTATYTYDSLNRLIATDDVNGATTSYFYDAEGNILNVNYGNGVIETRTYDELNRMMSNELRDGLGNLLSRVDYEREANGNISQVSYSNGDATTYRYDANNRLLQETRQSQGSALHVTSYTYDAVGNRLSASDSSSGTSFYQYDANDRLIQVIGAEERNYQYDVNGQRLSSVSSESTTTYQWNSRGQLESAEVAYGATTMFVSYDYDASGSLIRRTTDGASTQFLVDANRAYSKVIEETSNGGNAIYHYGNELISRIESTGVYYHHANHQQSVTSITDAQGIVIATRGYDAFGVRLEDSFDDLSPFGFTGEYTDDATGNVYLRARHLDPIDGQFLSEDPFAGVREDPTSLHRYQYAHGNPVAYTDPSGEFTLTQTIVTVGLVGGLLGVSTLVGRQLFEKTASVNWKGFSSGFSGGPSAVVVSASGGLLASAVATENAPYEGKVSLSDDYQRRYSGLMGTILAGVSVGVSTPLLDLSGGIGTFELEAPRLLTPRFAPTLSLAGAFLMYDRTVTFIVGKTFRSFLEMGYGAGGANGCGLGTSSAADTISTGINLVLPTGETNRQNTGQIRDAFGLANLEC